MSDLPMAVGEASPLRRFLFRDTYRLESPARVVAWWEERRPHYNLIVGLTGVGTLAAVNVIGLVGPGSRLIGLPPLAAIAVYGGLANLAFTAGWVAELMSRRWFGARSAQIGATLFRYGLVFSVGVTLLPVSVATLSLVIRVVRALVGA